MAVSSPARIKANAKYNKKNVVQFKIGFNKKTDADIIAKLEQITERKESKADYVKTLIRKDIKENPS